MDESEDFSAYADANGGFKYINRWDRLDHSRKMSGDPFVTGGWEYYSEYSMHMWGWAATGWAYEKNIPFLSDWAGRFKHAGVDDSLYVEVRNGRWEVVLATLLYGLFGGN